MTKWSLFFISAARLGESLSGLHPHVARQLLPLPLLSICRRSKTLPSSIMVHLLGIWSSHGNIGLGYGWLTIYETCRGFLSNKGYYQIIQVIRPWLSIETYIWFWRSPILGCPMLCNRSFPRKLVDTLILGDSNPSSCWLKSMRGWWSILFPEPKGRVSFEVGACPWQHQASQRCHLPRGGSKFADYLLSFWHS